MAEVIVVLGAVKTVFDIVKVCYNLIDDIQTIRGGLKELPKAFENLKIVLPLIEVTLDKTEKRIAAGELDKKTCEALQPVIEQCHTRLQELQVMLEKLKPGQNASKWKVFRKATYGLSQKKDFTSLAEEIMKYHVLIYQAGAIAPSAEEIGSIVRTSQTRLDDTVLRMIEQLQQERPRLPPTHSGLYIEQAHASSQQFYSNSNGNVTYHGPTQINQFFFNPSDVELLATRPSLFTSVGSSGSRPELMSPMATHSAIRDNDSTRSPETPLIEYDSPREIRSMNGSWSEPTAYSTGSENIDGSPVMLKDPTNWDLQAIRDAVSGIRDAGQKLRTNPKLSEHIYHKAIRALQTIDPSSPTLRVRKLRNLTASELGLTMVTRDRHEHIQKARAYNNLAYEAALLSTQKTDVSRVKLDAANIKAREARVLERGTGSAANGTEVAALRREAVDQLHQVIDGLVDECTSGDDYDSLAQAFLGCSRLMSQLVANSPRNEVALRSEKDPEDYLRAALAAAEKGLDLSVLTAEEQEKLRATKNDVQANIAKT